MTNLLWAVTGLVVWLIGARTTFWGLTRSDQPRSKTCRNPYQGHSHSNFDACTLVRDLDKSRTRRVIAAYCWPTLVAFTVVMAVGWLVTVGSYTVITKPMTTPAERTDRRLTLENSVALAEKEDAQVKAELEQVKMCSDVQRLEAERTRQEMRRLEAEAQAADYGYGNYEEAPEVR